MKTVSSLVGGLGNQVLGGGYFHDSKSTCRCNVSTFHAVYPSLVSESPSPGRCGQQSKDDDDLWTPQG